MVEVATGLSHTVGLKSNGTVISVGENQMGQGNVYNWKNIIQVAANYYNAIGLKTDGTVIATGDNSLGQHFQGSTISFFCLR
jgi:alpha-tubulin suppressor-like RCC1 family protein